MTEPPPAAPAFDDFGRAVARSRAGSAPPSLVVVSSIDSTNLLARRILAEFTDDTEPPPDFVVVARAQSAGRGRSTRNWVSAAGLGVYASRVFTLTDLARLQTLPLLVAVTLAGALNRWLEGRCRVKWPNDLGVKGRKIGGVLIETLLTADRGAWVIAGFGVNHGHRRAELPTPTATSLRCEVAGELPSLPAMAASLLDGLEAGLRHPPPAEQIVDDFRALAIHRPGDAMRCEVAGGVYNGAFAGFDEHGFLRLLTDTGEIRLLAGEILER